VSHYKCVLICVFKGICIQKTFIAKKCRTNASILRPMLYLRSEEWSRKIDFFIIQFVFVAYVNYEMRNSINFSTFILYGP